MSQAPFSFSLLSDPEPFPFLFLPHFFPWLLPLLTFFSWLFLSYPTIQLYQPENVKIFWYNNFEKLLGQLGGCVVGWMGVFGFSIRYLRFVDREDLSLTIVLSVDCIFATHTEISHFKILVWSAAIYPQLFWNINIDGTHFHNVHSIFLNFTAIIFQR